MEPPTKVRKVSRMCMEHIRDWSEGISNAPRIWRHANATVIDGKGDPAISKLHACGNSDRDQNLARNIEKLFRVDWRFGELLTSVADSTINTCILPTTLFSLIHR